jgi:hypothetical protein
VDYVVHINIVMLADLENDFFHFFHFGYEFKLHDSFSKYNDHVLGE